MPVAHSCCLRLAWSTMRHAQESLADAAAAQRRCKTDGVARAVAALTRSSVSDKDAAPDARLEALLQQYGALLRRTIVRVCPPELGLSCDDIEQEARISLWRVLRHETEIAFPVAYVRKVAVSAALRAIRLARARREESLPDEEEGPAAFSSRQAPASRYDAAERGELRQKLAQALARLADNRRLAVGLHLKGLTTSEIGALLNWSEPKTRNLVHRGLKDLRTALRALGIEYDS
jgi:RNA polymerase sigma factor (sigma-70 family)